MAGSKGFTVVTNGQLKTNNIGAKITFQVIPNTRFKLGDVVIIQLKIGNAIFIVHIKINTNIHFHKDTDSQVS